LFDILEEENDLNVKRTIIVEQEQRKKHMKNDLLQPLQYIAKNNYITFNKKQFKQTKGIPQGLCVSYILSSFYYANLEHTQLEFLRREEVGAPLSSADIAMQEDQNEVDK
jgi:telomerase reverse transcriptase